MLRIIAGIYKGRILKAPTHSSTRPTQEMVREAVFNICQDQIQDAHFLDLFAGSGSMGLEAISRGASHATLIESSPPAIACIKHNIALLGTKQVSLIPLNAKTALKRLSTPFDLVYIDPPYDTPTAPLITQLLAQKLLSAKATLFVEERYDPKNKSAPCDFPLLILKGTRRFGGTLLHQYVFGV